MKTNEKKVVFLNGVNSPYIEQAIFVLKKNTDSDAMQSSIVMEAERIVAEYAQKNYGKESRKNFASDVIAQEAYVPTFTFEDMGLKERVIRFFRRNSILFIILGSSVVLLGGLLAFFTCFIS